VASGFLLCLQKSFGKGAKIVGRDFTRIVVPQQNLQLLGSQFADLAIKIPPKSCNPKSINS
jgi:hypothetical protein